MAQCVYCESDYSDERSELGYNYCMADKCQQQGLNQAKRDFLEEYTPALLHKCNYFWIKKTELKQLNLRADLDR